MKYIWDTNIAIYYLQRQFPPDAEQIIDRLLDENLPVISAITEIELLCWKTENKNDLNVLLDFIDDILIIELEQAIKHKSAEIRKAHRIKLPDAIIAATAMVYDLTLITRNTRDFEYIPALKLLNPWTK